MTETHEKSIPSRIDDALKRPPPKSLWGRTDRGWEALAHDVRHFRTLSTLHQIIVVLFITGTALVIMSVLIHWFGFAGWF